MPFNWSPGWKRSENTYVKTLIWDLELTLHITAYQLFSSISTGGIVPKRFSPHHAAKADPAHLTWPVLTPSLTSATHLSPFGNLQPLNSHTTAAFQLAKTTQMDLGWGEVMVVMPFITIAGPRCSLPSQKARRMILQRDPSAKATAPSGGDLVLLTWMSPWLAINQSLLLLVSRWSN